MGDFLKTEPLKFTAGNGQPWCSIHDQHPKDCFPLHHPKFALNEQTAKFLEDNPDMVWHEGCPASPQEGAWHHPDFHNEPTHNWP